VTVSLFFYNYFILCLFKGALSCSDRMPLNDWKFAEYSLNCKGYGKGTLRNLSKTKVILRPTVRRPVYSRARPPSGPRDQFLFSCFLKCSLDNSGFVITGRPFWRSGL
jgi:hypothetical protein